MELYFTCPEQQKVFTTEEYKLVKGYRIMESVDSSRRELDGTVELIKACPLCGKKHQFSVSEVMCPSSRGKSSE